MNGISHECGMMMGLLNDIYRYHEECTHDNMMHALIPLEYVSAINGFVERDVEGENPCPITDAYLNAVRAEGIDIAVHDLKELAKRSLREAPNASEHTHAAALYLMTLSAQLRAGNAGKDGSHD